jgi:hypothetical protein
MTVSAFLTKTYDMVNNSRDHIRWSNCGTYFIIENPHRLAEHVLPIHFKHSNLATFVRQLNMYGFQKVNYYYYYYFFFFFFPCSDE